MISSLELARLCGVSQGTVDRALHDRPGVSQKTRELILAAAAQHGYRPHPATRELLSGKSNILGAVVPSLNVVFFMDFMKAVKDACDGFGLRLMITPVAGKVEFLDALDDFAARRISGVLAVPPEEDIRVPPQTESSLPIATLLSPCANSAIPLFAPDERLTGGDAVAYLSEKGHERILHVTYPRAAFAIGERQMGYQAAMSRRGLRPEVCVLTDSGALLEAIRRQRSTALFCHNDALALTAIRILEADNISVPGEISVLGVDNSPTFNQFHANLTTMPYPAEEIARKAITWIVNGADERPISRLQILKKLSVRNFIKSVDDDLIHPKNFPA